MDKRALAFIAMIVAIGSVVLVGAARHIATDDVLRLICYVVAAAAASVLKVRLPKITGTMSVNFLFILIGIAELHLAETVLIGVVAVLTQCFWKPKSHPRPLHVAFNVASISIAIGASYGVGRLVLKGTHSLAFELAVAGTVYFVTNTLPIAVVISLTERKRFVNIWKDCYFWSFPYYLVGAALAGLVATVNHYVSWQTSLLVLPVIFWIFRSYRLYLDKLEDEKRHVEEMSSLHLRTIEALALAIDAKDRTTHDHLRRVRVYAIEIAKELTLPEDEIEALRAAALLHDIGKLAVPEHIISKPGKLTPEEFEKMKIHPVVGAELLGRVQFPYPVVPIVRSHHERWDGTGYPDGLSGEEIPVGARILAAVDCLDALASDRQYRPALPLHDAMQRVIELSGKAFDPKIVNILAARYRELEQKARETDVIEVKLSTDVKIERGSEPAAGLQRSSHSPDFLDSIAAARQEAQHLFEISQTLGLSLSLDETLSVVSVRLEHLIPYDSFAIFIRKDSLLVPEFVRGENFRALSSLAIPVGSGLCGWVGDNKMPIVNGNPAVEVGYNTVPHTCELQSALAVPLQGVDGVVGVIALYRTERDAFTQDHLRVLLAITSKLALSIENSLKYQMAESSATTDYLTGLPNARSLFLHLDRELARAKRLKSEIAVLVCDLDGFKQINDSFGHLEGNRVLRAVARGFKDACREYDYVARMGGDEFVVVMHGISESHAVSKAAALSALVEQIGKEIGQGTALSLSCGRSMFPQDGSDAEQLLAEADRRMYSEKQRHYSELRANIERPTVAGGRLM